MKICNFVSLSLVLVGTSAEAQNPELFPKEQIDKGAEIYSTYCAPCHGTRMDYPGGSFDLRTFPPQHCALRQFGHQRQKQHAAVERPVAARRRRSVVGLCRRWGRQEITPR